MKRAINTFLIACVLFGCQKDYYPAPAVESFTPAQAGSGETVTITGRNLGRTLGVSFGGTPAANYEIVNSTTVTAIVAGGSTGSVEVHTTGGYASRPGFTFIACNSPAVTCKLPEIGARPDIGIGFPRVALRTPTTGNVKVSVIFVDFSDGVAQNTAQSIFSSYLSPSSENYISAASYGKLTLQL